MLTTEGQVSRILEERLQNVAQHDPSLQVTRFCENARSVSQLTCLCNVRE